MLYVIKAITLIFDGVLLQFIELIGFIGLATAIVAGAMRGPWFLVPVIAVAFALIDAYLPTLHLEWLAKASSSSERLGFLVLVYLVISTAGYLGGFYGRYLWSRRR